jgi:hypothetical protein
MMGGVRCRTEDGTKSHLKLEPATPPSPRGTSDDVGPD